MDVKTYSKAITSRGKASMWQLSLSLFCELQDRRLRADRICFSAGTDACAKARQWRRAQSLLWQLRAEVGLDVVAINAAISASRWQHAKMLLDMQDAPDLVGLNSAISGSTWQGALLLRTRRLEEDVITFCACISACEKSREWQWAAVLLHELHRDQLQNAVVACNAALSACEKAREWEPGLALLQELEDQQLADGISCNAAISACRSPWPVAAGLLALARRRRLANVITYSAALNVLEDWCWSLSLLSALPSNFRPSAVLCNAAMAACEKAGQWRCALQLFAEFPLRRLKEDDVTYGSVMSAFARAGRWQEAICFLQSLRDCSIITVNAAISACEKGGAWQHARHLLQRRLGKGDVNVITFSATISACEKGGEWLQALSLLREMPKLQLEANVITYNAAISACEKGSVWQMSFELLREAQQAMLEVTLVTFNAALGAVGSAEWPWALCTLQASKQQGLAPDLISFGASVAAARSGRNWHLTSRLLEQLSGLREDPLALSDAAACCEEAAAPANLPLRQPCLRGDGVKRSSL
ncbi:unnamed protein product [Effrenium voratum]|nr:unnamed protein product [Effrenium voratum]